MKILRISLLELPIFQPKIEDREKIKDYFFLPVIKDLGEHVIIKSFLKLDITGENLIKLTKYMKIVNIYDVEEMTWYDRYKWLQYKMCDIGLCLDIECSKQSSTFEDYTNTLKGL